MSTTDKVPSEEKLRVSQREKDITGCFATMEYSDVEKGVVKAIVEFFQKSCRSQYFLSHWYNTGFSDPSFHPNQQLVPGNPAYDKFQNGLHNLEEGACFGCVFHGTKPDNINTILRDGLDPKKRSGQCYGPGEYFSKTGSASVSYCRGGLEMLVFVVVLPSSVTQTDVTGNTAYHLTRHHSIPSDYVVVPNNDHQLPIGTIRYTAVGNCVLHASNTRRSKFLQLSKEVYEKSKAAEEGLIKAKIIQRIIAGKLDLASEHYEKNCAVLKPTSKREISWYVHQKLDEDAIPVLFPKLPKPMKIDEMEEAKIQSVDEALRQESEAKQRLETERKAAALAGQSHRLVDPAVIGVVFPGIDESPSKKNKPNAASDTMAMLSSGVGANSTFGPMNWAT